MIKWLPGKELSVKAFYVFAILTVIAFWVLYAMLSYFNRPASDDFSLIFLATHRGIISGTIWFYMHWTGSFVTTFIQAVTLYILQNSTSLLAYNIFLLSFLSYCLFFVLKQILENSRSKISNFELFLFSQLVIQAWFFTGFSTSEDWFWVVGSTGYLITLCLVFLSIGYYYKVCGKSNKYDMPLFIVFSFMSGNVVILYPLVLGGVLFLWLFYERFIRNRFNIYTVLYLILLATGFLLNLLAPGNARRTKVVQTIVPHHALIGLKVVSGFFTIIKNLIVLKLLPVFIFAVPLALLITCDENFFTSSDVSNNNKPLHALLCTSFALLTAVAVNAVIFYIVWADPASSLRSWMHISLLFIFTIVFILVFIAQKTGSVKIAPIAGCIFLSVVIYKDCKTFLKQYPVVKAYSIAEDKRIKTILDAKNTFSAPVLYLDSLPPSGMLLSAEIGRDTANYINSDMRQRFDLPFAIAVK